MSKLFAALAGALLSLAFGGVVGAGETPAVSGSAVLKLELAGPADAAFPLFDPVNESRWSPDWSPRFLAAPPRVAAGLVFVTTSHSGKPTVWLLDRYDAASRTMRYVAFKAGRTLSLLDISVQPRGTRACEATIRHVQTALDSSANDDVRESAREFPSERSHWEAALNSVLREHR
jgi:hypothetical protein